MQKKGPNHSTTWADNIIDPCLSLAYQRLSWFATIWNCIRRTNISVLHMWLFVCPGFSSANVGWSPYMPTGTTCSFIPLDVFFYCPSPCLMFLRLTVRCAACAAWTMPGLAKTDKTCVKLTCLYQVRVSSQTRHTSTSVEMDNLTLTRRSSTYAAYAPPICIPRLPPPHGPCP